ncbi:MAG: winged helix-turn-helix domain-containing protein, partial [Candidatus Aminicenantales bacterium]
MSQLNYKEFYLENILDFLWRQWSALGVAGSARTEDIWAMDPEALLVFSLEMARYEPRLFDEILDWLAVNGKWMDIQRLRSIVRKKDESSQRLVSAVAACLSNEPGSFQRKWSALALLKGLRNEIVHNEILFKNKQGSPGPKPREESKIFHEYGFLREQFSLRKMSKPVSVARRSNIRFLLRSLFGIGSRSECILYLLTHEAGHPAEIAKAIGLNAMAVWNSLQDLANSGLVLTRPKGKRKIEYWISQKRWWEFLTSENFEAIQKPVW